MRNEEKLNLELENILFSEKKKELTNWEYNYCLSINKIFRQKDSLTVKQKKCLFEIIKRLK
ncbi:hypothetical protein CIK00_20875 [Photobacterium carnosum]|jgi:hypothetical protein|uniref:Uncharacterized protein n=1 Tax=Photobacterium carnosum TaxID=2023717 RepID=A0A2N4ULU0_9GAMM|nr:hypothetical protein CIK00_20875 [Photobacterium carnosum]